MATFGSVAGCYVIYYLAERGGEAFLRKRLKPGHVERALAAYKRNGLMTLMIPALLPPPAPFKLFVLAAGVAKVRPLQFLVALTVARGARYVALVEIDVHLRLQIPPVLHVESAHAPARHRVLGLLARGPGSSLINQTVLAAPERSPTDE